MDSTNDVTAPTVKMVAGAGLAWWSTYTLQDWVAIITICYVLLQVGLLLPKYWHALVNAFETISKYLKSVFKRPKNGKKDRSNR